MHVIKRPTVNYDTARQHLNINRTDFWYSSSFGVTWPSVLMTVALCVTDGAVFLLGGGSQVVYGWQRDSRQSRYNLTCFVDARPQPQLYWTHHHSHHHQHYHHEQQQLQQQALHSDDTFHVFHLNSSASVLQVTSHNTYTQVTTYCSPKHRLHQHHQNSTHPMARTLLYSTVSKYNVSRQLMRRSFNS